jgi:hypothetical protein
MKYNDVSIIIQGPITKTTVFAIAKYSELAEVIVSFAVDQKIPDYLKQKTNGNIKVVTYSESYVENKYFNKIKFICDVRYKRHIAFQFYAVKLGIDVSGKKFIIKTRSDEFYENMDYFISLVRGKYNSNLFITNDMFFRRFDIYPYHPSDHLFGCNYILMKRSFEILFENIENERLSKYHLHDFDKNCIVTEQHLCIAVLNAMHEIYGFELNKNSYFNFFKKVNKSNLGNYKVCHNSFKRQWINDHNQNDKLDYIETDYIDNDQRVIKFM